MEPPEAKLYKVYMTHIITAAYSKVSGLRDLPLSLFIFTQLPFTIANP
jgi:hypothetical protein